MTRDFVFKVFICLGLLQLRVGWFESVCRVLTDGGFEDWGGDYSAAATATAGARRFALGERASDGVHEIFRLDGSRQHGDKMRVRGGSHDLRGLLV
jgi:hypothetical protein